MISTEKLKEELSIACDLLLDYKKCGNDIVEFANYIKYSEPVEPVPERPQQKINFFTIFSEISGYSYLFFGVLIVTFFIAYAILYSCNVKDDIMYSIIIGSLIAAGVGDIIVHKYNKKVKRNNIALEIHYESLLEEYEDNCEEWEEAAQILSKKIDELNEVRRDCQNQVYKLESLSVPYNNLDYDFYTLHPIEAFSNYIRQGRADTMKEALNLYIEEEREAKRDSESRKHRDAVVQYAARAAEEQRAARIAAEAAAAAAASAVVEQREARKAAEEAAKSTEKIAEEQRAIRKAAEEIAKQTKES